MKLVTYTARGLAGTSHSYGMLRGVCLDHAIKHAGVGCSEQSPKCARLYEHPDLFIKEYKSTSVPTAVIRS